MILKYLEPFLSSPEDTDQDQYAFQCGDNLPCDEFTGIGEGHKIDSSSVKGKREDIRCYVKKKSEEQIIAWDSTKSKIMKAFPDTLKVGLMDCGSKVLLDRINRELEQHSNIVH